MKIAGTAGWTRVVACVGFFDGVHLGHRELFRVGKERAQACGGVSVAVTFDPHPAAVVSKAPENEFAPQEGFRLLTPLDEKRRLIESLGIEYVHVVPFTPELMRTEPREFAARYLAGELGAKVVVVGFNFTFGFKGSGKARHLVDFGKELGFETVVIPPVQRGGEVVSSTAIRRALSDGDVLKAADFLGRPYSAQGVVVRGDGRGRSLGFPTANLDVHPQKLLPAPGVYACRVYPGSDENPSRAGGGRFGFDALRGRTAVANVGMCPTFGGGRMRLEVHIPAWSGNLYGEELRVEFIRWLRGERKFASAEELKQQIAMDITDVIESQRRRVRFGFLAPCPDARSSGGGLSLERHTTSGGVFFGPRKREKAGHHKSI